LFGAMFNDLEWPNTHFKVMPIFDTEYVVKSIKSFL